MIVNSDVSQVIVPTAIALGNFDGVHRGHQRVIAPVLDRLGLMPTVVTFSPHPQEFFTKTPRLLLTPIAEKIAYLEKLGIQQLVLLPFTADLARLTAIEFIEQILINQLQAEEISVGFNFRFGYQRQGSVKNLQQVWGDRLDITPEQLMPDQTRISSSAVRSALSVGEIAIANSLLGRPYVLTGQVVVGIQMGRTIGFPTANLEIHPQKFLPRDGVYAVKVTGSDLISSLDRPVNAVMNIGIRPTVAGNATIPKRTIEVHIMNWQGELYGQELTVELVKFLRAEQKFSSLDLLKTQIKTDCELALAFNKTE